VIGALALALAGTATASAAHHHRRTRTTARPSAPFKLQAFLLTSSPDSFVDLKGHTGAIEALYPTYFNCQVGSGQITGQDLPPITAYAAAHSLALMPRFNCQDGPTVHRILTEPPLRAQVLANLLALAREPLYAGLSLDLENDGAADRGALSSFVAELAGRLHAVHRKLTVVVDGVTHEDPRRSTGFYDDRALLASADAVFVLAWGVHWAGSAPGPIAPLPWVRQVVAYLASLPHSSRLVLGAPMYGLDWAQAGGPAGEVPTGSTPEGAAGGAHPGRAVAHQFSDVVALTHTVGAQPLRDRSADELTFAYIRAGVPHRVWYLDARSILDRLAIARAHGLKVGVWRLGAEDQALWTSPMLMR
jgi:spore germination protein YaaH